MEKLEEQYGYDDEIFMSETPDYLRCVVCSLVLRDPVQFLSCGHKLCSVCFQHYTHTLGKKNTELLCPVDRDVIQLSDVREDIAMGRVIGNLTVRCTASDSGCLWTGDLRDSNKHGDECIYRQPAASGADESRLEGVVRELQERILRCEGLLSDKDQELSEKDKQIASLQHNMQELMRKFEDKEKENDNQMAYLKQELQEMKMIYGSKDLEIASLRQNMQGLSDKFDAKDRQITGLKHHMQEFQELKAKVGILSDVSKDADKADALKKKPQKVETTPTKSDFSPKAVTEQPTKKVTNPNLSSSLGAKPVSTKIINIERIRGERKDTKFSQPGNHRIQFTDWCTVGAPTALIRGGMKVFYEVEFVSWEKGGHSQIGWASRSLTKINGSVGNGVGDVANSYAYDAQLGKKFQPGGVLDQGSKVSKCGGVLGVAVDMQRGILSFGINGLWGVPAIIIETVDINVDLFPAMSCYNIGIFVNFGERPFIHGPLNDTFEPLNSIV